MRPRMLHTWDCGSMVLKVKVDEWEFGDDLAQSVGSPFVMLMSSYFRFLMATVILLHLLNGFLKRLSALLFSSQSPAPLSTAPQFPLSHPPIPVFFPRLVS